MTVIVWDGRTLAADRFRMHGSTPMLGTKLSSAGTARETVLLGTSGIATLGRLLKEWAQGGFVADAFPKANDVENYAGMLAVTLRCDEAKRWVISALEVYERQPVGAQFDTDQKIAIGAGADYALGAMFMGADALTAVHVASMLDANVGGGADFIMVNGAELQHGRLTPEELRQHAQAWLPKP